MFCLCGREVLRDGIRNASFDNANNASEPAILFRRRMSRISFLVLRTPVQWHYLRPACVLGFLCLRVDPAGIVNKATSVAMDADFLVTRSLSFFEVSSDFIAFLVLSWKFRGSLNLNRSPWQPKTFKLTYIILISSQSTDIQIPASMLTRMLNKCKHTIGFTTIKYPWHSFRVLPLSITPWVLDDL
jgi:hypothetical protein